MGDEVRGAGGHRHWTLAIGEGDGTTALAIVVAASTRWTGRAADADVNAQGEANRDTHTDERAPFLRKRRISAMDIEALSPLLTLLDELLGHKIPLIPPPPAQSLIEDTRAAVWALDSANGMELRFLRQSANGLKQTLRALGYRMATAPDSNQSGLCLRYVSHIEAQRSGGGMVSQGEIRELIKMVPAMVLVLVVTGTAYRTRTKSQNTKPNQHRSRQG